MNYSRPDFFVTINGLPDEPLLLARFMKALIRVLRCMGCAFEYAWVAEASGRSSSAHIHLVGHGPVTPTLERLTAAAARVSDLMMDIDVRPWRCDDLRSDTEYLLKSVLAASRMPTDLAKQVIDAHIHRQGGRRLVHTSRGFFRSSDGAVITKREAVELANQARSHADWVQVDGRFLNWFLEHICEDSWSPSQPDPVPCAPSPPKGWRKEFHDLYQRLAARIATAHHRPSRSRSDARHVREARAQTGGGRPTAVPEDRRQAAVRRGRPRCLHHAANGQ